jgi:hypothetical protein
MTSSYTGPDEYPIAEIPPEQWWSENFAAEFACFKTRTAVFYSLGRWHSDPTLWREVILLSLPDGTIAHYRGYGRNGSPTSAGGALSTYAILEPGRAMRLTFDGPMIKSTTKDLVERGTRVGPAARCKIDLLFEAAGPLWNMKGDSVQAATMAGSIHIDQVGSASGRIEFDETAYDIENAYTIRDHSRGVRVLSHYAGHNWLNGLFPSGRAFYLYAMKAPDGSVGMSNAAVSQGDTLYPAKVIATEFMPDENGWGKPHTLVLDSELGEMTIEFAEVLSSFPVGLITPFDTCAGSPTNYDTGMSFDEPMRVVWNGEEGSAWSERGFSPDRG